ncbi:flagellar biosynthesis repressor FlbT [Sphingomonas sp. ac-8]|uniref:flagellar biosynthesis repressor FlbT n=1 Tax=Sphingomonas sp. ac-8 TaxID=3242977 RepID=UPI003A7F73EA
MTLRISLKDGEKMIVNGAVMRSVGRTDLVVENQVALMRGREVMSPQEATTPARRLYFACMLAYIGGDDGRAAQQDQVVNLLGDLVDVFEAEEPRAICARIAHLLAAADYYRALTECRALIAYESEALARLPVQAA